MDLRESVSAIKGISSAIKERMRDDESLVDSIDKQFDKNNSMVKNAIGKIDKVLTSASSSILCYVLLFVVIVLALLYKLT